MQHQINAYIQEHFSIRALHLFAAQQCIFSIIWMLQFQCQQNFHNLRSRCSSVLRARHIYNNTCSFFIVFSVWHCQKIAPLVVWSWINAAEMLLRYLIRRLSDSLFVCAVHVPDVWALGLLYACIQSVQAFGPVFCSIWGQRFQQPTEMCGWPHQGLDKKGFTYRNK